MMSAAKRAAIRREYRILRATAERTQLDVETIAGLDAGRYWKIENGVALPTETEAKGIARALKIPIDKLPGLESEAQAS